MSDIVPGASIFAEITSQGQAWAELIPMILSQASPIRELFSQSEEVLFTGCGSGLNAAFVAAPTFQALTGTPSRALPAAEIYLFPESNLNPRRKYLAVLLSRSGKTTEVVQAMDDLHRRGALTIAVTCDGASPLARGSDLALVLTPAVEQAIATTRSLTGMILTSQCLAAIVSGDEIYLDELRRLAEIFATRQPTFHALGKQVGQSTRLTRFAFVGNGSYYGLARESQLKVKEMTLMPADAYPMLDFRHGPKSNVDEHMLVVALISERARTLEIQFLEEMQALGGITWAICDRAGSELRRVASFTLELDSGLSDLARAPLYMPAIQYMAYFLALSRGLNPDQPRNLSYWVEIFTGDDRNAIQT